MTELNNKSLVSAAKSIDLISCRAMESFGGAESFEKELAVAVAVQELRAALTPEVMQPIMALMNTSLGFKTDQDPKRPSASNPAPTPYSVDVVREVFIESRLRGFHMVGNEVNIIAGNFYGTAAGFERKVKQNHKVANFKETYEVPRSVGDRGATVKCKAEWSQQDASGKFVPQSLEREFAIRVNSGMGADAVTGKAKRKLLAAVFGQLTGMITPEGDSADTLPIEAKAEQVAAPGAGLFARPAAAAAPVASADEVPMNGPTPLADKPGEKLVSPFDIANDLAQSLNTNGVSFDEFRTFIGVKNIAKNTDSWASFEDVPLSVWTALKNAPKTMAELVKKFGKPFPKTAAQ